MLNDAGCDCPYVSGCGKLLARADGIAPVGRGGAQRDQPDDGWATAAVEYG